MTILVTGGAGFIGSNFVLDWLRGSDERVVNLDALTYAGNRHNLAAIDGDARHVFVHGDIADRPLVDDLLAEHRPRAVVHFAAESHVDRSVLDATAFVRTNVQGTQVLLDKSRAHSVRRFVHVSTDEVYGSLGAWGFFTEETPIQANSPYSASKAGSDLLVRAAVHTHHMDCVITRCSNNYGPYQFPEKFLPLMIANATEGKPIPVYGDGLYVRDWLYVRDHCEAILAVLEKGKAGEVYNIGGNNEVANIDLVKAVLKALGKPESLITYVKDRPGHDRRYAIDASKIKRELGWAPSRSAWPGALKATVEWYVKNPTWWKRVKSGEYRDYYAKQYGGRL